MRTSTWAVLILLGCQTLSQSACGQQRVVSPLMCAANQGANVAGMYYGTMPTGNPASRRREFIRILHEKAIRAIRFPGGTLANLYVPENTKLMADILPIMSASIPEPDKKDFVGPWQFFEFCKEAGIEPIYQFNTVLYAEGEKVFLLADTGRGGIFGKDNLWGGPGVVLAPEKRTEAAKAVAAFVAEVRYRGFKVAHWELGNEEYGFPRIDAKDYADIAAGFVHAIHRSDANAQVWITLCDNGVCGANRRPAVWAETLLGELAKTDLPRDKNIGFTLHYVWPSVVDFAAEMVRRHRFRPRFAVTEFHVAGNGPYSDLSPRFGYALELAKYLIAMVPDPRIEILAMHDLVSQNFGILHFNAVSYVLPDIRSWDPHRGYEAMPAGEVYGLFGKLVGGTIVSPPATADQMIVALGNQRRIFVVNATAQPKPVQWLRDAVGQKTTRYEAITLTPKAAQGGDPLRVDKVDRQSVRGGIAGDGLHWTLPSYSISCVQCF